MNSVTCQFSVYFQIKNFWIFLQNESNTGDFTAFCHCWRSTGDITEMLSLQQNAGDLATMFWTRQLVGIKLLSIYRL